MQACQRRLTILSLHILISAIRASGTENKIHQFLGNDRLNLFSEIAQKHSLYGFEIPVSVAVYTMKLIESFFKLQLCSLSHMLMLQAGRACFDSWS
jgi:hypothetical protein